MAATKTGNRPHAFPPAGCYDNDSRGSRLRGRSFMRGESSAFLSPDLMSHCRFCFVRMLLIPVLMLVGGGGALSAAERFLAQDMNGEQHWNRAWTTDRYWREARDSGAFPEGMQADGVYHTNVKTIRTRDVTNTTDAFEGGTLVLE